MNGFTKDRAAACRLFVEVVRWLRWRYILFVGAIFSFGLLSLLPPHLFKVFSQRLPEISSNEGVLWTILGFGATIAFSSFVSSLGSVVCGEWIRLRVETYLRRRILRRIHQIPLSRLDGAQRGEWFTRMTGDLSRVEMFLADTVPFQLRQLTVLVGTGVLFVYYSGMLALLPIAAAAFLALANGWVQYHLAPSFRELRTMHAGILQLLIESLEGVRTIRSYSAEASVQKRFDERLDVISSKSLSVVRRLGALIGSTDFFGQILVTICLTAVGWSVARHDLTIERALFYPFFIGMFYGAAQSLATGSFAWNRFFIEGGRLAELLTDEPNALPGVFPHGKAVERLRLDALSIGHEVPLLKPLSVTFRKGEIWAFTGPSGCGKSTLLETLSGLRPPLGGALSVEQSDGTELLRREHCDEPVAFGVLVEQRAYVFEGTIRENLIFGHPGQVSDDRLFKVLEDVGLSELLNAKGGLDGALRDRGSNLSEGERYRLGLCRALLSDEVFMFLDEPFAALDPISAKQVVAVLSREKKHRAVLMVTHQWPEGFDSDGRVALEPSGSIKVQRRDSIPGSPAPHLEVPTSPA